MKKAVRSPKPKIIENPDVTTADQPADKRKQIRDLIIPCGLLLIIYVIAYAFTYDEKVYLGGDNLTYYHLGKALAEGKGYVDITSPLELPHNIYPPGYPFIMSVFMRLGLSSLSAFCMLNGVFGLLCVLLLFLFTLKITGSSRLGFTVAFFLSLSAIFLGSTMVTMSEIPGVLFTLIAMYMMADSKAETPVFRDYRFWVVLACTIIAYYIRSSSLALLPAVLLFYLLRRKWMAAVVVIAGFGAAIIPWMIRTKHLGGSPYIHQFRMKNPYREELGMAKGSDFMMRIVDNLQRYVTSELPAALLQEFFPNLEGNKASTGYWVAGSLILLLILYGMIRMVKKQPALVLYLMGSGAILLLWPQVWIGSRFLVPVMPFILLAIVYGLNDLISRIALKLHLKWNPVLLCAVSILFLISPLKTKHADAAEGYPANYQNYFTAAEWAQKNLPPASVFACRKPEIFYHFSGFKSVPYLYEKDEGKLMADLKYKQVTHVIVDQLGFSSTGMYLVPTIKNHPASFKILYQTAAPETYVVSFTP